MDGNISNDLQSYSPGQFVVYDCHRGYALHGSSMITCNRNGRWSDRRPFCTRIRPMSVTTTEGPIFCQDPGVSEYGELLDVPAVDPLRPNERYPTGIEIRYGCLPGYEMEGFDVIYCMDNGQWSLPPPECIQRPRDADIGGGSVVYCPDPGPISNGLYQVANRPRRPTVSEHPVGTLLQYTCDPPYILHGSSEITCERTSSWSDNPPSCVRDCGRPLIQTRHRITRGKITDPGEWPWVVAITVRRRNNTVVKCGGALVNRNTILTAAHCLTDSPRYSLYFGKFHLLTELDDSEVRVRSTQRILLHPNYNETSYSSDIALVKFHPSIRYTERIRPVCLPTTRTSEVNLQPNNEGYVTGWGLTEINAQSEILLVAPLPVQPTDKCIRSYEAFKLPGRILPGMYCAGPDEGEISACTGDSGSPFVFYNQNYKQYTIEGIVSFSIVGKCGEPKLYTVFTKVSDFINWILINIR